MIKIFRYIDSFNMQSSFKTWAYRIAFNESITVKNSYRHELDQREIDDTHVADDSLDDKLEVEKLLNRLEKEEKEMLILKYTAQLSDKEIAETLGVSLGAIKMRLSRAKKKLKAFFD